jgi:hypothetical protein
VAVADDQPVPWLRHRNAILDGESAATRYAADGCQQLLGALFLLGVRAADDAVAAWSSRSRSTTLSSAAWTAEIRAITSMQ